MVGSIGQKAINLQLIRKLFPDLTPRFIVIDVKEFFVDRDALIKRLNMYAQGYIQGNISQKDYENRLNTELKSAKLDRIFTHRLMKRLQDEGYHKVSYRTSASLEDLSGHSFAGQYITFLDKDIDEITIRKCARECTKSLFSPRVLEYVKTTNNTEFKQFGSIIIQEMFYGAISGVLFTENGRYEVDVTYDKSWRNTIVEGENAYSFTIDKSTLKGIGNVSKRLDGSFRKVLDASLLLESKIGRPLDIEWSVDKTSAALLQFRPVTNFKPEYMIEWDCTNIAESYPGITLPLTYSFIQQLYANVYPEFLKLLGYKEESLKQHKFVFENMLGYLNGRVYYNINNWYELIKLLPGYKYNKQFFEAMLIPAKDKGDGKKNGQHPKLFNKLAFVVPMSRFIWLLFRTDTLANGFTQRYRKRYDRYKLVNWDTLQADQILAHFAQIEHDLLEQWAVPILNDFRTMVFHGLLKKIFFQQANNEEYVKLLSGIYDQTSVEPIRRLKDLALLLRPLLTDSNEDIDQLAKQLEKDKAFEEVKLKIDHYLAHYGGRSPDELKLENPRLAEDYINFLTLLVASARGLQSNVGSKDTHLSSKNIEKEFQQRLPYWRRLLFSYIIRGTKNGISKRERFRFYRAQVFGLAREAYLAMGKRFTEAKLLSDQNDIFWLTDQEIKAIVLGHAIDSDTKVIVEKRKAIFKQYEIDKMDRRLVSTGLIAPLKTYVDASSNVKSNGKLTGLGVSKGIYEGEVVVVRKFDPTVNVKGKVLVTEHTDPGWTLLFLNASAVVVERGNALSHASIVAREIGIPAVVAAEKACDFLRTDQRVLVNGSTGEVITL